MKAPIFKGQDRAARFLSKVDTSGGPDACWLWTRGTNSKGYGTFHEPNSHGPTARGGRSVQAHRASWEIHVGPIPFGLCVLHRCDTPRCVNPAHLFLGTKADNVEDMHRKGRAAVGERSGKSPLSEAQVLEIRRLAASGAGQRDLAARFGVSQPAVNAIVHGRTWKHLLRTADAPA